MVKIIFLKILLRMVIVTLASVVLERIAAVAKGMMAKGEGVLDGRTTLFLVKFVPFAKPDTVLPSMMPVFVMFSVWKPLLLAEGALCQMTLSLMFQRSSKLLSRNYSLLVEMFKYCLGRTRVHSC